MNVTTGWPRPKGPSAVTVTVCGAEGSVSVTDAPPEPSVIAITLDPLVVPLDRVPALVLNNMLAPLAGFAPPELPGARLRVRDTGKVVPRAPVWLFPAVIVRPAGGLPTMIQPPWVCVAPASVPVTVKWQKPGALGAVTVSWAGWVGVMVGFVRAIFPAQAGAPSKVSKTADDSVTFAEPLWIFGCRVTVPPAGTMIVSGLRSQKTAGLLVKPPAMNSIVAL